MNRLIIPFSTGYALAGWILAAVMPLAKAFGSAERVFPTVECAG